MRFLTVSTKLSPEIAEYPDTNRFGVLASLASDETGRPRTMIYVGKEGTVYITGKVNRWTVIFCSCSNLYEASFSQVFPNSQALGEWMVDNHASAKELWVRIYKSASGKPSVTWGDCVVEAIRYGWIDGQKKPLDDSSFLQRLSPRKPGSNWSSKNREYAKKLIQEGRMAPAGLAHVEAAKKDGRWEKAYAGSQIWKFPKIS